MATKLIIIRLCGKVLSNNIVNGSLHKGQFNHKEHKEGSHKGHKDFMVIDTAL